MAFHAAAKLEDLWDGEMKGICIDSQKVLLVNVEGKISAFVDRCAHQSVPMSTGKLERGMLTCSAHHWTYNACTGQGINPANAKLHSLAIKIENGMIFVDPKVIPS